MGKKFVGILVLLVMCSTMTYASNVYDKEKITDYDFANIYINGELSLEENQGFIRASDGALLPSTLNWNDTTYVPLRLLSELLGADVDWNGSILLDLELGEASGGSSDSMFTKTELDSINVPYRTSIDFDITGGKTAFVENMYGEIVEDLEIRFDSMSGVTISNAYLLGLEETFKLTVLKDNEIIEQSFYVNDITLESFERMNGKWFTVLPADENAGFSHPTIMGFSAWTGNINQDFNLLEDTLIVEGSNEGVTSYNKDSYTKQINERFSGELSVMIGERNYFPFMVSMFPRPIQDGFLYSHALDRDTLFQSESYFESLGRGNIYRIDEQFLAMIDYTQDKFEELGHTLDQKVAIAGFSASSDWATRMTMIHPEAFKFVISNIVSTMPMTSYNGHDLPYPLGMSNIQSITGVEFDLEAYKAVPQFWFVGGADTGDGTTYDDGWGNYGSRNNEWNQEGIDYRLIFGNDPVERRAFQMDILGSLGYDNIEYISYEGLPHTWDNPQLDDIDDYIDGIN